MHNLFFQLLFHALATVYFDGSLCHPDDPTFPTCKQKRRASCAAYICFGDSQEILGGRILSWCSSSTTSAEVEYEALILGLEGLRNHWLQQNPSSESAIYPVSVFGDCKMVLQQMNNGSRPRKMESLYKRASKIVEDIQTCHPNVQFSFQHIPRTQNLITDRLCAAILAEKQLREEKAVVLSLSSLSSNAAYLDFLNSHLTEESNALKFSRRADVYRYLSKLACRSKEWTTLIEIGERWSHEIQNVWPRNDERRDQLFVEAVAVQLFGLEALGKDKELSFRRRKHQYVLSKHACISEKVGQELCQVPASVDMSIASREMRLEEGECPPLIHKWIKEAVSTSIWMNDTAYWMSSGHH